MEETTKKARRPLKRLIIPLLVGVCVLLGAASFFMMKAGHDNDAPFSTETRRAVNFPLYYPVKLPPGFTLDKTSISSTNQVVLYSLKAPGGAVLSISIQERPEGANLDAFYAQELSDVQGVPTKNGVAKIGKRNQSVFASLITDKSWIIGTAQDSTLQEPLREVFTSLEAVR